MGIRLLFQRCAIDLVEGGRCFFFGGICDPVSRQSVALSLETKSPYVISFTHRCERQSLVG